MPVSLSPRRIACIFVVAALVVAPAIAAPVLRCRLEQGGEVRIAETPPGSNPYNFKAIDLDDRFRFRAVVIGTSGAIDYVKLYAYYRKQGTSVLMHQATYYAPSVPDAGTTVGLTGLVTLYAPPLGRELQYSCDIVGA